TPCRNRQPRPLPFLPSSSVPSILLPVEGVGLGIRTPRCPKGGQNRFQNHPWRRRFDAQVHAATGPSVPARRLVQVHRVQVDVSIDVRQPVLVSDQHALEGTLKEAADGAVALVEGSGVGRIEIPHHMAQRGAVAVWLDVVMVRHEAPAQNPDGVLLRKSSQETSEDDPVQFVGEDAYLAGPAVHDVEVAPWESDSLLDLHRSSSAPVVRKGAKNWTQKIRWRREVLTFHRRINVNTLG